MVSGLSKKDLQVARHLIQSLFFPVLKRTQKIIILECL